MTDDLRRLVRAVHLDCEQLADGTWRVSGGAEPHLVDPKAGTCDCRDHQLRGGSCKHLERVRLALGDRDAIAALAALVPTPKRGRRRKIVTSQRAGSAGGQATTNGGADATDTPPAPACAPLPLPEQEGGRPRCAR